VGIDPSSTDSAFDITIGNAASSSYALTVMTVVVGIFVPLVVGYQRVCGDRNRWTFVCVIAALRLPTGTGSPVNPIAIT
jgi:cytochrome d ubiquinol oxidase subunit II